MPNNTEYRISELEKDMSGVRTDVKAIMENHLPHIQSELMRLSTSLKIFGGLILTALSALIAIGLS